MKLDSLRTPEAGRTLTSAERFGGSDAEGHSGGGAAGFSRVGSGERFSGGGGDRRGRR